MEPQGYSHLISLLHHVHHYKHTRRCTSDISDRKRKAIGIRKLKEHASRHDKADGQLVLLGFDVTIFTPAAYQRRSLQRPCEI